MDNRKIAIFFEKKGNGEYKYKFVKDNTGEFKELWNESVILQLNENKYSQLNSGKNTKFMLRDMGVNKYVALELTSSLYNKLVEYCKSKNLSDEECCESIKKLLEQIVSNSESIKTVQHEDLSALCFGFANQNEEEIEDDKEEKKVVDISKINPNEIIETIKSKVIAQDDAVNTIVNNIYNNQVIIDSKDEDLIDSSKSSILVDGPTGTGKTLIVKQVAQAMDLPMVTCSATNYSAPGYKGSDLSEMLVSLLDKTKGNLELAERGIIVIDEFDKLAAKGDNSLEMRKAVQQGLLTFLSGGKFPIEYKGKSYNFDTSKITFICLGAFTDLRERKIAEELDENGNYTMLPEDYIKEGIMRELVGRFSLITATKSLKKEDLIRILKESKISPLHQLTELGQKYGVEILYDEDFISRVADEALKEDTGARALQTVINGVRNVLLTDLINNKNNQQIIQLELNKDILDRSMEVYTRKGALK